MGLLRIIGIKAPSASAARGKSGLAGFSIPLAGDGGLQDLFAAAARRPRAFNRVIVESISRLSGN
jgi:hypothetical protein